MSKRKIFFAIVIIITIILNFSNYFINQEDPSQKIYFNVTNFEIIHTDYNYVEKTSDFTANVGIKIINPSNTPKFFKYDWQIPFLAVKVTYNGNSTLTRTYKVVISYTMPKIYNLGQGITFYETNIHLVFSKYFGSVLPEGIYNISNDFKGWDNNFIPISPITTLNVSNNEYSFIYTNINIDYGQKPLYDLSRLIFNLATTSIIAYYLVLRVKQNVKN